MALDQIQPPQQQPEVVKTDKFIQIQKLFALWQSTFHVPKEVLLYFYQFFHSVRVNRVTMYIATCC
jgi:hypothetical protein